MVENPPTIRLLNGEKFRGIVEEDRDPIYGMITVTEWKWVQDKQSFVPTRERMIPIQNILSIDIDK